MEVFRYFWTYICSVLTSILDTPQRLGPIFPCRLGQNTSTCFRKDLVLIPIHIHCNDTTEESQEHWVCVAIDMQQTKGRAKHGSYSSQKKSSVKARKSETKDYSPVRKSQSQGCGRFACSSTTPATANRDPTATLGTRWPTNPSSKQS